MTDEEKFFLHSFEYDSQNLTIDELKQKYFEPLLNQIEENFRINAEFMSKYPFLLNKNFIAPKDNRYTFFWLTDDFAYRFDNETNKFEKLEINSIRETKYFYKDLSKPLLIDAEFNKFNLEFLSDTVRDSRDFAGDNHIYIKYADMNEFSMLMYYVNLTEICETEKFVFIINDDLNYPCDFKKIFNIDYSKMTPKRLRIEEMNRYVHWWSCSFSGALFSLDLLDQNPYMSSKFYWFSQNVIVNNKPITDCIDIKKFFSDCTKKYTPEQLLEFYNRPNIQLKRVSEFEFPDFVKYLKNEYADKKSFTFPELFKAYFIFRMYYIPNSSEFKNINLRISPVIVFEPHTMDRIIFEPLSLTFKYSILLGSVRNQIKRMASVYNDWDRWWRRTKGTINWILYHHSSTYTRTQMKKDEKFKDKYYVYRFEDLKLYPEETCRAICECLNVPYSDEMMKADYTRRSSFGEVVKGFDTSPLYRKIDHVYSDFDVVRLKIYYDILLKHYGYETFDFNECPVTDEDVKYLLKFPFRFEKNLIKEHTIDNLEAQEIRNKIYNSMIEALKLAKAGKIILPKVIKPKIEDKKESK